MAGQQQQAEEEEQAEEEAAAVAESTTKVTRTFHAEICPADDLTDEPKRRWEVGVGRKKAFAFSFLVGRTIDCRRRVVLVWPKMSDERQAEYQSSLHLIFSFIFIFICHSLTSTRPLVQ